MGNIVVVDPSINTAGLAVFADARLIHAETVTCRLLGRDICDRCRVMAEKIIARVDDVLSSDPPPAYELIVEWPRIYAPGKQKAKPDDQIPMAGVCAAVAIKLQLPVTSYRAAAWKGQLEKVPCAAMVRRNLASSELILCDGLDHNALDAIGIGLYHLGRFKRKRVYAKPS